MIITLTKTSDLQHRLAVVRDDGSREIADLVSRSFLLHDLLHFAIETEAKLRGGFWGLLAAGQTLKELGAAAARPPEGYGPEAVGSEAAVVEMTVGCFTSLGKDSATPEQSVEATRTMLTATGRPIPDWLTDDFARRVQARMRDLKGRWRAVRFGGSLELRF